MLRQKTKEPPYLKGNPLFGSAFEMRRDPLKLLTEASRLHGDFVRFRLGPYRVHLLSHPDYVAHVLQKNPRNYLKDGYEHIEIVGNGLLASEGDFWKRQRRVVQPAFHRERLAVMAETMTDAAENMMERWGARPTDETFDIDAEMSRLTLEIVGRTLFGTEVGKEAGGVGTALASVLNLGFQRTGRFLPVPLGIPTSKNRRYRDAVRHLNHVVDPLISARRINGGGEGDLLDMLLEARDEDAGEGMGERQLRDEVMTILTAGYETTARALSWTWYLIDANPQVREKLEQELDGLERPTPGFEDLERLAYTKMIIQESMRLFPPVWGLSRLVAADDEVGEYRIPKGSRVVISPYVTHRHPDFWEDPETFDPERFTPERSTGRPRYAYFPFSGGPRQCIGNNFATMEATLILATIARRYRLILATGHPVEPEPSFTLRSRHGMRMVPAIRA